MTRSAANGKPAFGRIGCGNMTFHIDRCRARLRMQRGLAGGRRNHLFHAGQATADHAPATQRRTGDQFLVQRQTCQKTGIACQNLGRHHHVARFQRRIQPAGDAERDDTPESGRNPALPAVRAIAADRWNCRSRSCRARPQCGPPAPILLRSKPAADHSNCDQPNCPRARRPPPPKSHPDPYHPAVGASQISVPRQRPERKELRVAMITQIKHPRKARSRVTRLVPEPFVGLCGF